MLLCLEVKAVVGYRISWKQWRRLVRLVTGLFLVSLRYLYLQLKLKLKLKNYNWNNTGTNWWIHFRFELLFKVTGQNVKIQLLVNQGGTNHNRCTQRLAVCMHRPTNEPDGRPQTRSVWPTLLEKIVEKQPKVDVNGHLEASWVSQPHIDCLILHSTLTLFALNVFAVINTYIHQL